MLNLAEELRGNVSKACMTIGLSRDTFYRYRELAQEGGVDALIDWTITLRPKSYFLAILDAPKKWTMPIRTGKRH